jgi:hypothetical protein
MIVAIVVKTAAAVATAALAACSLQNMVETVATIHSGGVSEITAAATTTTTPPVLRGTSTASIVQELQHMKRRDLLALFQRCATDSPAMTGTIMGDYDGVLLDNNGLTRVTGFLTNGLFGRGRTWNGKAFLSDSGTNRFHSGQPTHSFDVSVGPSRMRPYKDAVRLDYSQHQQPWSLWKTMQDELRLAAVLDDGEVWIGMGCMAWSGSFWNASPFCLYRVFSKTSDAVSHK